MITKIVKINFLAFFCVVHLWSYGAEYNTEKIFIVVNQEDAVRNPILSLRADTWKVSDVKAKTKHSKNQAIAVVCEGRFPVGVIGDDLFRSNGELNRDYMITASTMVRDICNQQEDLMRVRNPNLFKR